MFASWRDLDFVQLFRRKALIPPLPRRKPDRYGGRWLIDCVTAFDIETSRIDLPIPDDAKQNRESARSAAIETLKATAQDDSVDEATRTLAGEKLVRCAEYIELENTIESIASAKGFPEICAYINEDCAVITVRADGLNQTQTATICEIVTETANISMDKIKIVEVK